MPESRSRRSYATLARLVLVVPPEGEVDAYAVIDGVIKISITAGRWRASGWDDHRRVMVSDKRVIVCLTPTRANGMLSR